MTDVGPISGGGRDRRMGRRCAGWRMHGKARLLQRAGEAGAAGDLAAGMESNRVTTRISDTTEPGILPPRRSEGPDPRLG